MHQIDIATDVSAFTEMPKNAMLMFRDRIKSDPKTLLRKISQVIVHSNDAPSSLEWDLISITNRCRPGCTTLVCVMTGQRAIATACKNFLDLFHLLSKVDQTSQGCDVATNHASQIHG